MSKLRDLPAQFDTGGTAPTITNVSQAARSAGSVANSAISKALRMWLLKCRASSMAFIPGAYFDQSSWPKYVGGASGHNEEVVRHDPVLSVGCNSNHRTSVQVDIGDLCEQRADIRLVREDRARRRRDHALGQDAGGYNNG